MARASRKEEGLRVGKRRGYGKSVSVYSPALVTLILQILARNIVANNFAPLLSTKFQVCSCNITHFRAVKI